jgi:antitoxin (DNA-binding transcriptional repressor) of toxin-antitoxin stability system
MNTTTTMSNGMEYMRNGETGEVTVNGERVGIVTPVQRHDGQWWQARGRAFPYLFQAVRYLARADYGDDVKVTEHGKRDGAYFATVTVDYRED